MKPVHAITTSEVEGWPSRPATAAMTEGSSATQDRSLAVPDPEVRAKPVRRRFTTDDKLRILEEADRCSQPGQIGALLRREGLYSSHLTVWRQQRRQGTLAALAPAKRGPKPQPRNPLAEENHRLRRENEQLTRRLKQAETIIEFQKKVS